jgi:Ca2+-binding EF-hand superfamily protein
MHRTRANESQRINQLEQKLIEYQNALAKTMGASAADAAVVAAEAMGIWVDKPAGVDHSPEDTAGKTGVSAQTMLAMEGLKHAMEEGNIVVLSHHIRRLEETSGFEAPKFGPNQGGIAHSPPGTTDDDGEEGAETALRSLPRMQLWAAATLHRRVQAIAMAVSRGVPVRDVLHGDNVKTNLLVIAPIDFLVKDGNGGSSGDCDLSLDGDRQVITTQPISGDRGGGGGLTLDGEGLSLDGSSHLSATQRMRSGGGRVDPGLPLADARRIVIKAKEGQGLAVAWMSHMPADTARAEICEAVLGACDGLAAQVSLSRGGLRLAIDSCQRAVAASLEGALSKARQEANKTLDSMRLELRDGWEAAAAARTRQAVLQQALTAVTLRARRLGDRLANGGDPGDAEVDELDAAEEEAATLRRTLARCQRDLEVARRGALAASNSASAAVAERDAQSAAAHVCALTTASARRALHELRAVIAVTTAAAAVVTAAPAPSAGAVHEMGVVTAGAMVVEPSDLYPEQSPIEMDPSDEPDLDASRREVDAWLEKQDAVRAAFDNPTSPVSESMYSEQATRRANLGRTDPTLAAWADAYDAIDELGGGREAVDALTAQIMLSPQTPLDFLSRATAALRARCQVDRREAHAELYKNFLDAKETLRVKAGYVPVVAATAQNLANPTQVLALRDVVPELEFRVAAVTACTAYEEIVRHIRALGLDDPAHDSKEGTVWRQHPEAGRGGGGDKEGGEGRTGAGVGGYSMGKHSEAGVVATSAAGRPMATGMRGECAAVLRRVCGAGVGDGLASVTRRLDDERHRYARRVAAARATRQSLLDAWSASCDTAGADAGATVPGLVQECGEGVDAETLDLLRQRVAHMQGWARICDGRRAVQELRAHAAFLARSAGGDGGGNVDRASRHAAATSVKEAQRALAASVRGLQTVLGAPPRGEARAMYRSLHFTQIAAGAAEDAANMLVVPPNQWITEAFAVASAANGARVDRSKLRTALGALGVATVSATEVDEIFDAVDVEGSGLVDVHAFRRVVVVLSEREERRRAEQFAEGVVANDGGGSRTIDREELWDMLDALGLELSTAQMDMLWEKCDVNGSGVTDAAHFRQAAHAARLTLDHAGNGERFYDRREVEERLATGATTYTGLTPRSARDVAAAAVAMIAAVAAAAAAAAGGGESDDTRPDAPGSDAPGSDVRRDTMNTQSDACRREPASISVVELDQIVADVMGLAEQHDLKHETLNRKP